MKSIPSLESESPSDSSTPQRRNVRLERCIPVCRRAHGRWFSGAAVLLVVGSTWTLGLADQVQMRNGDQYFGKVLSLNEQTLVIQSDVLGTIRLPRGKVANVDFGGGSNVSKSAPVVGTNELTHAISESPHPNALALTNTPGDLTGALRQFGGSSNALEQIQKQLSEGGPEAKDKFNELFGGLMSGKLSITDIRAQAQTTADQVRSLRKDLGEDAGSLIDGYLAILDSFLKETAPANSAGTKTSGAPTKPKAKVEVDE